MKLHTIFPPALALVAGAIWTGYQRHSLSTLETTTSLLRERLALARNAGHSEASATAGEKPGSTKAGPAKIDWKRILESQASGFNNEIDYARMMLEIQRTLTAMSTEDLLAQFDIIAALDASAQQKQQLESMLLGALGDKDPKLALDRFIDRLGKGQSNWELAEVFRKWTSKDAGAALQWLDAQIAAGKFENRSLIDRNDSLAQFEVSAVSALFGNDPAQASDRLGRMPGNQAVMIYQTLFFRLKPGMEKVVVDSMRSSNLTPDQKNSVLGYVPYLQQEGGFGKLDEFMTSTGTTAEEKKAIISSTFDINLSRSDSFDALQTQLEKTREWAASQGFEDLDRKTGEAIAKQFPDTDFSKSSSLAMKYFEESGNDDILIGFLSGELAGNHPTEALTLLDHITNEGERDKLRTKLNGNR